MSKNKLEKMFDLDKCRVCLEKSEKLYPLHGSIANCDLDVNTMITYCTSIELEIDTRFPNGVCVPCFRTVRIAYNFILQFRENHRKLTEQITEPAQSAIENNYECCEDNVYEINEDSNNTTAEQTELLNEYDDADGDAETVHYLQEETTTSFHKEEPLEEIIEYEVSEDQVMVEEQPDFEEYTQQEVEMENLDFFVNNLETTLPQNSTNFQHVTVKVVKKSPDPPEIQQPQTVLRRKIKIRFACPICQKVYFASFESGLVPHMSLHAERFTCNICSDSDTLYNSDSFLNHFMQHHRYQCPYCGKSFNRTGTLTAHIKTHYKFRYHCSHEGCPKSFPTQWSLKKHEAVHSNSCEYSCSECNLFFKTYDTYMYHLKKHGGRRFLCMCCGRTFMQSVHLKYHMQQHTGIKHFKCNWCVKSYTSSSQLKKHKRRHHPDQQEAVERPFIVNIAV